jgi:hypothetical protein
VIRTVFNFVVFLENYIIIILLLLKSRLKILQSARENALSEKRKLVSLINEYKQHVAQCTNKEAEVYKELEEKSFFLLLTKFLYWNLYSFF